MARSLLLKYIKQLVRDYIKAEKLNISVDAMYERTLSRRDFILGNAATLASIVFPERITFSITKPKIAIIGAGIAGLTSALYLKDAGLDCTIYEAQKRVGGRILSKRGSENCCLTCHAIKNNCDVVTLDENQFIDIYGEFIDSNHKTMLALARRFKIELIDTLVNEPKGSEETYYFLGSYYSRKKAIKDFLPVYKALKADLKAAGYPTTYKQSTEKGRLLDRMSVYEWIETRVPGGHSSPMGRLFDVAYNIEYGAETSDQSSLNLVYLLAYNDPKNFTIYGESDERYVIKGGCDLLTTAIAKYLGIEKTIKLGWKLESLSKLNKSYVLTFQTDSGIKEVKADVVILAIPFAVLKDIDYSNADFDQLKIKTIKELGIGINGKLFLQFTERYWNKKGPWGISSGNTYSDTGYQTTWDTTRGQSGKSGILVKYAGGNVALKMKTKHCVGTIKDEGVMSDAEMFLKEIEPVFPGISRYWNGKAICGMSHLNPFFKSSYAYWRIGQCSTIAGYEGVRQGNIFFAGEHTSYEFQGFMEGAAVEGIKVAKEIIKDLKSNKKKT